MPQPDTADFSNQLKLALADVEAVSRCYYFEEIASTSTWARDLINRSHGSAQIDGTLVVADHQTKGRGRLDRRWESSPRKSLLFTHITTRAAKPEATATPRLQSVIPALAVVAAIAEIYPHLQPGLKYPNDVFIRDRKVAGILAEQVSANGNTFLLIGVGVNVNQQVDELPQGARWPATSLFAETGVMTDRIQLLKTIFRHFARIARLCPSDLLELANRQCCILGRWVQVESGGSMVEGVAELIAEDGGLVLRNPTLPGQHIHTGEVATVLTISNVAHP